MAEIVNNPKTIERLREEIDSLVGKTRLIQESDLTNLHYLQAVIKEGLRLHPLASLFARLSQEGCMIGGYYMPEDTTIIVNTFVVMRDLEYWEDPDEFRPERFLPSSKSSREHEREKALKYISLGIGRRGCPIDNLAYIFIASEIGTMVQRFDWKIKGDKVDMDDAVKGLTLTMAHPLKCTPFSRPFYYL